jgi:hypothetical protein
MERYEHGLQSIDKLDMRRNWEELDQEAMEEVAEPRVTLHTERSYLLYGEFLIIYSYIVFKLLHDSHLSHRI